MTGIGESERVAPRAACSPGGGDRTRRRGQPGRPLRQ